MQNYIIIANGNFLVKEIIVEAITDKIIIALDGAANKLARIGIKPHIILGDFDSISEADKRFWGIQNTFADINDHDPSYIGHQNVLIIPTKNQKFTDLTKAIQYCDTQNAKSITIICALGGRIDHHEGAIRCLRGQYKKERPIILHGEQQSLRFVMEESFVMEGHRGDKCGVIGFPMGSFSSHGLEYDVQNYKLQMGFSDNICNSLKESQATITVAGEALIIMPPQLSSQRAFMKKSESERIKAYLRDASA